MLIVRRIPKFVTIAVFIFIASFASWTLLVWISNLADSMTLSPNRCEIIGLFNNCPAQPTLKITRRDGMVLDELNGASKSSKACMVRAEEYYHWCQAKKPITARFFHKRKLIKQQRYAQRGS